MHRFLLGKLWDISVIMNKFLSLFTVRGLLECRSASTRITAAGKDVPKVKNLENRITLINPDNSASITDFKHAHNLALRRDLKLVKIEDVSSKTRRPVYKLMTSAEYHEEELQKRKERQAARQNNTMKGEKLLSISTKIGDHDLQTNIKKMIKLLEKQYQVRIIISVESAEDHPRSESMYSMIEKSIRSLGKAVQKRTKGNTLRFQLVPSRDKTSSSSDTPSSGDDKKGPL